MNITTTQSELNNAISKVSGAIAKKNTLPVLQGLHCSKGYITANDMEITIQTKLECEGDISVVFPKEIEQIVKSLPNGLVEIEVDDNFKATIKAGKSKFNINCMNGEEFPQQKEIKDEEITVDSKLLESAIDKTITAVSTDQTQPSLTGIEIKDGYFTATNTYRLNSIKVGLLEGQYILPAKSANEIKKLCKSVDEVNIKMDDSYMQFEFDDVILISRLIEGKYPNWKQILPNDFKTKIIADKKQLANAVKRAGLIAKMDSNVISLIADVDKLTVKSSNDGNKAEEILEIELEGEPQQINVDVSYMTDLLKCIDNQTVEIELISSLNPLYVEEGNAKYLIMPVRPSA